MPFLERLVPLQARARTQTPSSTRGPKSIVASIPRPGTRAFADPCGAFVHCSSVRLGYEQHVCCDASMMGFAQSEQHVRAPCQQAHDGWRLSAAADGPRPAFACDTLVESSPRSSVLVARADRKPRKAGNTSVLQTACTACCSGSCTCSSRRRTQRFSHRCSPAQGRLLVRRSRLARASTLQAP